jgi:hypothetical protein
MTLFRWLSRSQRARTSGAQSPAINADTVNIQYNDSFSKALKLLAKPKLETRLGAIYALGRIAEDSEKDHWAVIETLTGYVRTRYPARPRPLVLGIPPSASMTIGDGGGISESEPVKPRADVQAIAMILKRLHIAWEGEGGVINLGGSDLAGVDFSDARLTRAIFTDSDLGWSYFIGANLRGANFYRADLTQANFNLACLAESNLNRSNMTMTSLWFADLTRSATTDVVGLTAEQIENIRSDDPSWPVFTSVQNSNAAPTGPRPIL